VWFLLVLLVCAEGRAHAGECSVIPGGVESLGHVDAVDRLHFIQGELRHAARRARMWTWGWVMGLGVLSGAQLALLPGYPESKHVDLYVGSGTAFVGMLGVMELPMKVMGDQRRLDAEVKNAPATADPCALLADAERLLLRDAKDEAPKSRILIHVGNILINTGAGLILGLAFHHWTAAFINGVAGIAIGEALVLTRPMGAVDSLTRYRLGDLGAVRKPPAVAWGLGMQLDHDHYIGRVTLSF
jgi:hypothetical protein